VSKKKKGTENYPAAEKSKRKERGPQEKKQKCQESKRGGITSRKNIPSNFNKDKKALRKALGVNCPNARQQNLSQRMGSKEKGFKANSQCTQEKWKE